MRHFSALCLIGVAGCHNYTDHVFHYLEPNKKQKQKNFNWGGSVTCSVVCVLDAFTVCPSCMIAGAELCLFVLVVVMLPMINLGFFSRMYLEVRSMDSLTYMLVLQLIEI